MGDTASDHAVGTQTLEKNWDSYDATIHTDGAATHGSTNSDGNIIVTTGPQNDPIVHRQCSNLAGKLCSFFQAEEKAVQTALKLVQEMSLSTRCASFQIVFQDSNKYKICIHPSTMPTATKTRSLTLWPRIPREGAILLSHCVLAILESVAMSWQTWLPKK